MRKAVVFDEFAYNCPYFDGETEKNNGYGCNHENNDENVCLCFKCPLGIEAEQEDLTDKADPDAIKDEIDWDGLCEDGEVCESEYLLVDIGETQTEDERKALYSYDIYMHRYDKKWADEPPPITNAEKFKEVFGIIGVTRENISTGRLPYDWWLKEYKAPESEGK